MRLTGPSFSVLPSMQQIQDQAIFRPIQESIMAESMSAASSTSPCPSPLHQPCIFAPAHRHMLHTCRVRACAAAIAFYQPCSLWQNATTLVRSLIETVAVYAQAYCTAMAEGQEATPATCWLSIRRRRGGQRSPPNSSSRASSRGGSRDGRGGAEEVTASRGGGAALRRMAGAYP